MRLCQVYNSQDLTGFLGHHQLTLHRIVEHLRTVAEIPIQSLAKLRRISGGDNSSEIKPQTAESALHLVERRNFYNSLAANSVAEALAEGTHISPKVLRLPFELWIGNH